MSKNNGSKPDDDQTRKQFRDWLKSLLGNQVVSYWPALAQLFEGPGALAAALLTSQILYWSAEPKVQNGGWIVKGVDELAYETGLTKETQKTARRLVSEIGLIECKLTGAPRQWHYRIDLERLQALLCEGLPSNGDTVQRGYRSMVKPAIVDRDRRGRFTGNPGQPLKESFKTTVFKLHSQTTSSSLGDSSDSQEQEEEVFSESFISLLNEIGVFKNKRQEVQESSWSEYQLAYLILQIQREVQEGKQINPASVFLYRIQNQDPASERTIDTHFRNHGLCPDCYRSIYDGACTCTFEGEEAEDLGGHDDDF